MRKRFSKSPLAIFLPPSFLIQLVLGIKTANGSRHYWGASYLDLSVARLAVSSTGSA